MIETHFIIIDYIKDLLFNSTNKMQEKQTRDLLEIQEKEEKFLEV